MTSLNNEWKNPEWLFNKVTGYIFGVILLFTTLALINGTFRLFYSLYELINKTGVTGNYLYIFSDVLTLVILLELSRSLFQYFMEHTVRLPVILDAGIVFVLRDIMIGLFEKKFDTADIYALSTLFFVLGVIRIGYGFYYCKKNEMSKLSN
ncbi:MAG: phosphate-starvation-inducible PsiE family protein [Gammaproteobacteria bacterium]|nr:phosphate-starvation-inducible PsiE family protein [Gammaproteobacteria bacterium]